MRTLNFQLYFLLCFNLTLVAQNWTPLNKNYHYNYRYDKANIITNTILVDSFKISLTGDSVFYLNRIMLDCDTCHQQTINGITICDSCFELGNQPQFLQRKVIKYANGIYNFRDTGNIVMKAFAGLGSSWLFDSIHNIQATVISIVMDSLLTQKDSVKTIALSSGDTVKLAKNFGIILFPFKYGLNKYHRLTGIDELGIGEHVPNFKDIYSFNVGDLYCYKYSSYGSGNDIISTNRNTNKHILGKTVYNDSLVYQISEIYYEHVHKQNIISPWITDDYYSKNSFTYNIKYSKQNDELSFNSKKIASQQSPFIYKVALMFDSNNISTKIMGSIYSNSLYADIYDMIEPNETQYHGKLGGTFRSLNQNPLNIDNYFYNNMNQFSLEYSYQIYKAGLGRVGNGDGYFEGANDEALVGYIKNGVSHGTIYKDDVLLSVEETSKSSTLNIYPNPASDKLIIRFNKILPHHISIKNIVGQEVFTIDVCNQNLIEINTSIFSSGMYFLQLNDNDNEKTETHRIAIEN